jgi:8-oxo-dGTP pyrophosphatase MutT (NUDIX family)
MKIKFPPGRFVAVYLALVRENQVLLLKRQNTGFEDGNFGLIAGHVEKAESITQAVIREASEESGIRLLPEHLNFCRFRLFHGYTPYVVFLNSSFEK